MQKFSRRTTEQLGHYVYLYIDPRDDTPFYIGKGKGNRAFAHLRDTRESAKAERIRAIRKSGAEPRVEILKHSLTEEQALLVEATAIDLVDVKNLTNTVRGHGSRHGARARTDQIEAELNPVKAKITDPVILINIRTSFRHDMPAMDLYDVTRSAWRVSSGGRRDRVRYACAVFASVVREVYRVNAWVPGGASMRAKDAEADGRPPLREGRYEFIGHIADEKVRTRYVGKSVAHQFPPGNQNPIKYVNCD